MSVDSLTQRKINRATGQIIAEFGLIKDGDRVGVGLSGGKDSSVLLHTLVRLRERAPIAFELAAFTIDQGKFKKEASILEKLTGSLGVEWVCFKDPLSHRLKVEQPYHGCDLCSRYRRTAVYRTASSLRCNVVALGHTADDFTESLLRNLLFNGRSKTLPVAAVSSKGEFRLIRPFARVWETWTAERACELGLDLVPCACGEKDGVRKFVRDLIGSLDHQYGGVSRNILNAALGTKVPVLPILEPSSSEEDLIVTCWYASSQVHG